MTNTIQISFIIPVYNAERFVEATVNSILTAPNPENISYEIICVNDCSTDNSATILNQIAARNKNVIIVNREQNGHLAAARNSGLKVANGQWICMIDADDLINQGLFKVFNNVLDTQYDIIYFDYDQFVHTPKRDQKYNEFLPVHEYGPQEIHIQQRELLTRRKMQGKTYGYRTLGLAWGKIYRSAFLKANNLFFIEEMRCEEDLAFNLMCLSRCKKTKKIDWILIHYRLITNSLSHIFTDKYTGHYAAIVPVYKSIVENYYTADFEMKKLYPYRILWVLLFSVLRGPASHANNNPWALRKKAFLELVNRPEYVDVFESINIPELDFSNSLLAWCVKKRFFFGCCLLERILQLKNKIANIRN